MNDAEMAELTLEKETDNVRHWDIVWDEEWKMTVKETLKRAMHTKLRVCPSFKAALIASAKFQTRLGQACCSQSSAEDLSPDDFHLTIGQSLRAHSDTLFNPSLGWVGKNWTGKKCLSPFRSLQSLLDT